MRVLSTNELLHICRDRMLFIFCVFLTIITCKYSILPVALVILWKLHKLLPNQHKLEEYYKNHFPCYKLFIETKLLWQYEVWNKLFKSIWLCFLTKSSMCLSFSLYLKFAFSIYFFICYFHMFIYYFMYGVALCILSFVFVLFFQISSIQGLSCFEFTHV